MSSGPQIKSLGQRTGGCGAIVGALFFLVFLLAGLFFMGVIGRDVWRVAQVYIWRETPCQIVSSAIAENETAGRHNGEFRLEVEFRYQAEGRNYTSRRLFVKEASFQDYGEVQRLALKYPPEAHAVCYVHPRMPGEAVLRRGWLWFGLALLLPAVFVAIGGGGMYGMLRSVFARQAAESATAEAPKSGKAGAGRMVRGGGVLFFGIFLIAGLAFLYMLALRPLWLMAQARDWQRVPCEVLSSGVRTHSDSDGSTYSVNIFYRYEVKGREYRSNRYSFMRGSSSGYSGKAAVVNQFPAGMKTFCWVNPSDPGDAVLNREWSGDMWWGLFPLPFVAVGLGGIIWSIRSGRRNPAPGSLRITGMGRGGISTPAASELGGDDESARFLKAQMPPLAKFIGGILVAAFWNGIVSVFVWQAVKSWLQHRPEWFLTIFIIPFVLIGLALIGFVIYSFLGLFNPRPRVVITPGTPGLGQAVEVQWEFSGRTQVIRELRIYLEGREEATYRRGTSTATDKAVFATVELVKTSERLALHKGSARVNIPAGLMHSWASPNNKIVWALHVHGMIDWWPDVKEEFPMTVRPCKQQRPS